MNENRVISVEEHEKFVKNLKAKHEEELFELKQMVEELRKDNEKEFRIRQELEFRNDELRKRCDDLRAKNNDLNEGIGAFLILLARGLH